MDTKKLSVHPVVTALIAVAIGAGSFFGGMKYQQMKTPQFAGRFGGGNGPGGGGAQSGQRTANGQGGQGRFGQSIRPVNGEILSSDDKSITVKLMDGSTKIVLLSETTTINKAAEATKSDLKTGETVAVFGAQNADGSVTAQNIQLNPMFRMGAIATPSATPAAK